MTAQPRHPFRAWPAALRRSLATVVVVAGTGCAMLPTQTPASATQAPLAASRACLDWYRQLDAAITDAGVRDAGAPAVPGYPFLRVDRYLASLRDRLPAEPDAPTAAPARAALVARLLALDLQARQHEIANLPATARAALAGSASGPADTSTLLPHTRDCGRALAAGILTQPERTHAMLQTLAVEPDYVSTYRVLGLYPLTRIAFLYGVRRVEDRQRTSFNTALPVAADVRRLRLAPPWRPARDQVTAERLRAMLRPASDDPLGIAAPSPEQLDTLFAHFAPVFDLGVRSDDDRPGALVWTGSSSAQPQAPPGLDTDAPVVYRQLAHTRHGQASLLQLVYTLWFGGRPAIATPIDLLAGRIDGLVWRVTLSPDGVPLVYDSMHPCGCYHQFFAQSWVQSRPAPDPQTEWAFSPAQAPPPAPDRYLELRVAPGTHYLQGLVQQADTASQRYAWRDYDELRSMPMPDGSRRSVFDREGFIPGTDRAESWLFWPMGIARAGAMRQWGRHATAFVGQRHFDDARLIEQRFDLDGPPLDQTRWISRH